MGQVNRCALSAVFAFMVASPAFAQQPDKQSPPVIVQPGAPGEASKILPPTTRAVLPMRSAADTAFMQGMIMHHAQAVEMTALIASRTQNKKLRLLGDRISHSQSDEMGFMRRWLTARGEPTEMTMPGMDMSHHHDNSLMPGMLTPKQMTALRNARGADFDKLFLMGMIQHHEGALTMVGELFKNGGAGQDADLFNFATEVDSGQRAEIRIMRNMLNKGQ